MARIHAKKGTEKDKNDPEKNLMGRLKNMELPLGTAERERSKKKEKMSFVSSKACYRKQLKCW